MTDTIAGFFDELATREREPLLGTIEGTLRVDLEHESGIDHWFVAVDKKHVKVSHRNAKADTIIRVERELFEGMVTGRVNAMAAMLRGVVGIEGNIEMLVVFQRLFPGPPASRGRRPAAVGGRAS